MVWYSHLFQNFPQFIVIHTVKGFGIVNKAEIDDFLDEWGILKIWGWQKLCEQGKQVCFWNRTPFLREQTTAPSREGARQIIRLLRHTGDSVPVFVTIYQLGPQWR